MYHIVCKTETGSWLDFSATNKVIYDMEKYDQGCWIIESRQPVPVSMIHAARRRAKSGVRVRTALQTFVPECRRMKSNNNRDSVTSAVVGVISW